MATKPFAKEIRTMSWFHTISTLSLLILALSSTILLPIMVLKLAASILAGLLLIRMFIIYHDHQHHTILTKSTIAEVIMTVFGMYMLSPTSIWKRSHDHHHNHNSKLFSASIGSYPIVTRKKYLEMTPVGKFTYLAIRHPLTIALGYFSMFIIGMCLRSFISNPRKHYDSLIALIIHITVAVLLFVFLGWQAWFFMFFLPFLIAFALGAYLFYAQHDFPGVEFYENKNWVYEKAALESSSYMKMNPLLVCLAYPPEQITQRGVNNISNMISHGFDCVTINPGPEIWRKLMSKGFFKFTNWCKSTELALFSSVPRLAIAYQIPLIWWGENAALQLGDLNVMGKSGSDGNNLRKMNTLGGGDITWLLSEEIK